MYDRLKIPGGEIIISPTRGMNPRVMRFQPDAGGFPSECGWTATPAVAEAGLSRPTDSPQGTTTGQIAEASGFSFQQTCTYPSHSVDIYRKSTRGGDITLRIGTDTIAASFERSRRPEPWFTILALHETEPGTDRAVRWPEHLRSREARVAAVIAAACAYDHAADPLSPKRKPKKTG